MKLVIYILKKIIPFFFISLFMVALILNLIDLFMNITRYIECNASLASVLKVMLLYAPKTIWYAAPIGFLFTVTYVLSDLYAHNEMEALFASGISLIRFVLPVFIFSIICCFSMFFFEDRVVVPTLEQKTKLQNSILNKQETNNNHNVVVQSRGSQVIYKASYYKDEEKKLEDLYVIIRNEEKDLLAIIYAPQAYWNMEQNNWSLVNITQYTRTDDSLEVSPVNQEYLSMLDESYEIFKSSSVNIDTVSTKEAKIYIEHLKKSGLPYYEAQSVYYKKFAFPLIFLIAGMLAVGLTGRTKKNVLLISLSLSIVAIVLYYVFQMATMVMAKTQYISPFMGAWSPDILFFIIACVLLKYQRT